MHFFIIVNFWINLLRLNLLGKKVSNFAILFLKVYIYIDMSSDLDCNKIMCKYKLNSKEDAKKWLLANHPDKGGDVDSGIFTDVTKCYQEKEFCSKTKKKEAKEGVSSADRTTRREKIYTCMRQTENWSKILKTQRFDNANFDEEAVIEAIHDSSPKLEQLLRIIKQVDENDMRVHGKLFKHFIFSDVKAGGYGAKILASAFIAEGYTNLLEARNTAGRKSVQLALGRATGDERSNAFCILSSSTLFESSLNQKLKKKILQTYNKRPENIHGEEMRFIILDSGFKEGIDLFDVKYVHIFELSMTIADLKQTVGRATRTCGQKGLNFEPNVGWPLYVYNYYIAIPEEIKDLFHATDKDLLDDGNSEFIFKNKDKLKEATILYSKFDKSMVSLSEQLYKLAPVFSVDFELTKNIHKMEDITYLYDGETDSDTDEDEDTDTDEDEDKNVLAVRRGGARRTRSTVKCSGKCGLRSTKDIPATVKFLKEVYLKNKHNKNALPKKHPRGYLCAYMKQSPAYCEQVNSEWARRASMVPNMMEEKMQEKSKSKTKSKKNTPSASKSKDTPLTNKTRKRKYKLVFTDTPITLAKEVMKELDLVPIEEPVNINKYAIVEYKGHVEPAMKQKIPGPPPRKLNFAKMRDFIKTNYSKDFTWPPYAIENKCGGSKHKQSGGSGYAIPGDREFTAVEQAYGPSGSRGINEAEVMDYDTTQFHGGNPPASQARHPPMPMHPIETNTSWGLTGDSPVDESDDLVYNQTGLGPMKGGSWFSLPGDQEYIQDQEAYGNGMNQGGKDMVYQERNTFSQERPCVDSGSCYTGRWGGLNEPSDTAYNQTGQVLAGYTGAGYTGGASRAMTLNPTQDFARRFFTPESPYKGMLLWHSVGTGKCHAIDTPILLHDGTVKMVQDVLIGDTLMGDDSKPRTVLSLARGEDILYDIIPTKGEKYTVNSEHILCLKYSGSGSISHVPAKQANLPYKAAHIDNKTVKIKTSSFATREEAENYLSQFTEEDRIIEIEVKDYLKLSPSLQRELKGYRKGVEFSSKPLEFDPYIIGLWLGGSPPLPPTTRASEADGIENALKKYDLIDNKHIPFEYKCNDRYNRLQLLAGLIDTDGYYSAKDKCYEITQKSTVLANDILFLARSLGFAAYSKKSNKSWTYKGVKKTNEYNRMVISGDGLEDIPVKITRKMAVARCQVKDTLITGIRVEKHTDCGDYYGFTLDGNCRYLLGDFTVTHNTCSAVAVASSSFEQAGYTILWVTRTTLKSDVYKNIFDDVCHAILAEKMRSEDLKIPDKNRRRLLSDSWIEPISYRTFSNLLDAKPGSQHKLRQFLAKRNGPGDILRKTLIVIDEAHKLYGGDLKASERPKMEVMERWLRESYAKSGKDSARLLIMTATPFTDSPMEMFKLINLCKENPAEHITTDPAEFKSTYMNKEDVITSNGSKALANSLSGYISYLNRENDPTQFAQPIMIEVPAIMSHVEDADLRAHFYSSSEDKKEGKAEDKDVANLVKEQLKAKKAKATQEMKDFKEELKTVKKTSKNIIKERKSKCKTIKNKAEKADCVKQIGVEEEAKLEDLLEKIQINIAKLKAELLEMKKKPKKFEKRDVKEALALLKRRLLQESMLVNRCKSIKMKRVVKNYLR